MSQIIDIVDGAGSLLALIRWLIQNIAEYEHRLGLSENPADHHEIRIRLSQLRELLKRLLELRPKFANVHSGAGEFPLPEDLFGSFKR
ncbi:hypothetical protein A3A71_02920 [Candidatus Berkelbacteria bacterium RIFCSPLOWO2_01_FULL_50_28]|uniref:Uncharacterized protein n=1 Tax=Candidatus Berkelbacteria bacterium RIFCSPLOWO2_01_FULL_50_28 TaxID=1797471 RepID=A0A1F5EC92_9BACT|nr:MAG: hypothetical protein A2807_02455 [Candidatus Berkelbacteria bacterium RIFCSPHIGHO2_01_FULL_50_36]OGD62662.1 MAG: hypothetical protein A3F39_00470 [Candidatus Berkelbacteria bacterium RIFCSPHIGHO2_12_FULL_50_11]OGD64971.1 MAG: hypothetical protein A3A71_02920 [Candidatus Berkelbacteria bacterium RIFCSPLOWO2_01_FULL_50_28]